MERYSRNGLNDCEFQVRPLCDDRSNETLEAGGTDGWTRLVDQAQCRESGTIVRFWFDSAGYGEAENNG